jgi:hypothetical protein
MAEKIAQFTADPVTPQAKNSQGFPWAEWGNGDIWMVKQNEDYTSQRGMLAALTKRAIKDNKTVRFVRHEGAIEFCFEPK